MKRFSLFLMIVLLVSAIFISCSAEPAADATKVATVALSLDTAKELEANTVIEYLPAANTLYWYYTATKSEGDNGFKTGETGNVKTSLWGKTSASDEAEQGLPSWIGQIENNSEAGTWFSTGSWDFHFYAYKEANTNLNSVYEAEVTVQVSAPTSEENNIGGTADIVLQVTNDPRQGTKVKMGTGEEVITVDLGNSYDAGATYSLEVYVDEVKENLSVNVEKSGSILTFKCDSNIAEFSDSNNQLHLVEFKLKKGDTVYASGSIGLVARQGYTYTISGDLDSLESVAWVGIHATVPADLDSANQTITELTITDEYQLRAFASYVNQGNNCAGMTINLADDILLTQPWTPIGNGYRGEANPKVFKGTFNGNDHTITGLTSAGYSVNPVSVTDSAEYTYGLFGYVEGGTINDVKIESVAISGGSLLENAGAVVGYLDGGTVANCRVLSGSISGFNGIGGVVGRAYGTVTINDCSNAASITGSKNVAGIVGFANPTATGKTVTITGNTNTGAVTRDTTNGNAGTAGGVAGIVCYGTGSATDMTGTVKITGNTNTGTLSGEQSASIAKVTSYYDGTNVNVQN